MKLIIAGSRSLSGRSGLVEKAIEKSGFTDIVEVVSGTAVGVDRLGEIWGLANKKNVIQFPANWGEFGKSAGFRRNISMAEYADALLAIWDGASRGTAHMIQQMRLRNKPVSIFEVIHRAE